METKPLDLGNQGLNFFHVLLQAIESLNQYFNLLFTVVEQNECKSGKEINLK